LPAEKFSSRLYLQRKFKFFKAPFINGIKK
jgi:hypothetical protein